MRDGCHGGTRKRTASGRPTCWHPRSGRGASTRFALRAGWPTATVGPRPPRPRGRPRRIPGPDGGRTWGDHLPSSYITTIQTYVFRLREVLESQRPRRSWTGRRQPGWPGCAAAARGGRRRRVGGGEREELLGWLQGTGAASVSHGELAEQLERRGRDLLRQLLQGQLDLRTLEEAAAALGRATGASIGNGRSRGCPPGRRPTWTTSQAASSWRAWGWVVWLRPLGAVQVHTPSGVMLTVQPPWCLNPWWVRHNVCRFAADVAPAG